MKIVYNPLSENFDFVRSDAELDACYIRRDGSTPITANWNVDGAGTLFVDKTNKRVGIGTASSGAKLDVLPFSSSETVFRTKSLQSTAPLGSELVGNGNFSTVPDTSWTWGAGWTHDTTNLEADHAIGNTAALTQSINVTNGATYQVAITIKNKTAGYVTLAINGVYIYNYGSTTAFDSNATYQRSFLANTTGAATLSITPNTNFNGSVDDITVKLITGVSQPNFSLLDDAGSVMAEIRGKNSLSNLALGTNALCYNTTGYSNTALGYRALYNNTTGYFNTALGAQALYYNTTGYFNTSFGYASLFSNTTGYNNTAFGYAALYANTTGYYNAALGVGALQFNTTGYFNSAIGRGAGRYISGGGDNKTSSNSLYFGYDTRAFADGDTNEIVIGASTVGFGSNTIAYGNNLMTKHIFQAGNMGIGETSPDYKLDVNGTIGFTPGSSVTPVDNGDVVVEATNNTTLTFKLKGSDGTIRSGTLTLS